MRPLAPQMIVRLSAALALVGCGRPEPSEPDTDTDLVDDSDLSDDTDPGDDTDVQPPEDTEPPEETDPPVDTEPGDTEPGESDTEPDESDTEPGESDPGDTEPVETDPGDTDPPVPATWSEDDQKLLDQCVVPYTGPGPEPIPWGDPTAPQLRKVTGCFEVAADASCPAADDDLPWADLLNRPCVTRELLCVTGFVERRSGVETHDSFWAGDSGAEPTPVDQCCYTYVGRAPDYACGRPFVQEGHAVTAPVRAGGGWAEPVTTLAHVSAEERAAALERWRADAAAEHASVAAFSRLVLHLIHHGAPASLVQATVEAAADEVRHATAAFGIVSALSGREEGPGPLPVVLVATPSLLELAVATAVEGGVGESLAAGVAAARLARATEPRIREALAAVVEEEARHAGLAWRIVDWCVEVGGDEVRAAVDAAVAGAVAAARRSGPPEEATVRALGLPGPAALRRAWEAVLDAIG